MKSKSSKSSVPTSGDSSKLPSVPYVVLVVAIACAVAILHRNHLANMYESDRHFSHLSTLERELGFRTEMGLYYSYFKTIIDAPSFGQGLHAIMNDNLTEYPSVINTLNRFNLYPEVFLGLSYRCYQYITDLLNIPTRLCWNVNRGQGLSPILSCEGLGEPPFFYIEGAFLLNGILMGVFFVFGTYLSESTFGGILVVASFFFNHGECTRVQWTPPLRESFGYPFFVIQMFVVTHTIRTSRPGNVHTLLIALTTVCFMLPWQFAQFALLTQTVSIFGLYVLQFIGSYRVKVIVAGQMIGSIISTVFLFGNKMMISSFFVSCVLSVWVVLCLESVIKKLRITVVIWICQVGLLCVGTLTVKKLTALMLNVTDDVHIGDILRSKFFDFKNFHTMLYTCAAEFDFMESETPGRILKTLLLPCVLIVLGALCYQIACNESLIGTSKQHTSSLSADKGDGSSISVHKSAQHTKRKKRTAALIDEKGDGNVTDIESNSEGVYQYKPFAEILYNVFQLVLFTVLAILIMRLKLFWTPHMCLMTSLLASRKLFGWVGEFRRHYAIVGAIIGLMSIQGLSNLQWQWGIVGEYQNIPTEQLIEWINKNTPTDAAFAGPMSLMANVKLSTGRPIVNHPHYEDAGLRARTVKVYTLFSRKPEHEIWSNLRQLQVTYAVLENAWCVGRSRLGCSMAEIWDVEDEENRGKVTACERLHRNPGPYFRRVFRNEQYEILELNKNPTGENL